jgi:peptidyl-prolyl cis-trans isomerase SurA
MMHRRIPAFAIALSLLASCQVSKPPADGEAVLFSVNERPVSAGEFEYVYRKNSFNSPEAFSEADVREYLDLFIQFKLKIAEAQRLGYDTASGFRAEFEGYRQQLARPYLAETRAQGQLLEEAYERMRHEIRAAHILVRVAEDAPPADTAAAYATAAGLRERALAGEDFAELAAQHSGDPSARMNRGDLGYFSAFQMVYPFETAAYTTEVGGISGLVRTQFGYHIIVVRDRIPNRGKVKVAHIMVRDAGEGGSDGAGRNRIFEIHEQLQGGADWHELCRQFSDDFRTRDSGGELPLFSAGQIDPEFSAVAFQLSESGQVSDPFRTQFGWHIVRLIEKQPLGSFEEMKDELEERIARDGRSQVLRKQSIGDLKARLGYLELPTGQRLQRGEAGAEAIGSEGDTLFLIGPAAYTTGQFLSYARPAIEKRPEAGGRQEISTLFERFVEQSLRSAELQQLERENRDYRLLVREYFEGLLLFEIMEDLVWSLAGSDSLGLAEYFQQHRDRYQWPERAEAVIFSAADTVILGDIRARSLTNGDYRLGSWKLEADASNLPVLADSLTSMLASAGRSRLAIAAAPGHPLAGELADRLVQAGLEGERLVRDDTEGAGGSVDIQWLSPDPADLEAVFNRQSALALKVERGFFGKGQHPALSGITWAPGASEFQQDSRYLRVVVKNILPAGPKSLDETRGSVISDYQEHLEVEWIASLRQKYPVQVDDKEVRQLIRKFENESARRPGS